MLVVDAAHEGELAREPFQQILVDVLRIIANGRLVPQHHLRLPTLTQARLPGIVPTMNQATRTCLDLIGLVKKRTSKSLRTSCLVFAYPTIIEGDKHHIPGAISNFHICQSQASSLKGTT